MTLPVKIVDLTAMFLWCHAAILLVAWVRAVARTGRRNHVGHFVSLAGEMVPMVAGVVILVFLGAFIGLPSVVVFLAVVFPAGIVVALLFEMRRLEGVARAREARRLALALGLAGGVFMLRGGW